LVRLGLDILKRKRVRSIQAVEKLSR
jgi:hypothetical protein